MKNVLDLTKKLVEIPSFVDRKNNEAEIGDFLYNYLRKFSYLTVEKQMVQGNRFNIVAYDKFPTNAIICDHIDTVQPQNGWITNPCEPVIKDGKVYGLGSSDSKGNVATVLSALENIKETKGLMLVLYIDEEYMFKGMLEFIKKYKKRIKPKIIASADGGDLELGFACRGLIEILFQVQGEAGHAALPTSGKNAITGTLEAYQQLKKCLDKYSSSLGKSTINLSYIKGGKADQANVIPDFAECVIEIRTTNEKLNALKVIEIFESNIKKLKLKLISKSIRNDYGSWLTPKNKLKFIARLLTNEKYTYPQNRGYVDLQMLWESFNKPICFTFGVGEGKTAHKPNEYIKVKYLKEGVEFWTAFIKENCSVQ